MKITELTNKKIFQIVANLIRENMQIIKIKNAQALKGANI